MYFCLHLAWCNWNAWWSGVGNFNWETTLTSDSDSRFLSPAQFISRLAAYQMFHLAPAAPAHLYTTNSLINVVFVVVSFPPSLPPSLAPSPSGRLIGHQLNSTCSPARWNTILRRREALTSYPVSSAFDLTLLLLPLLTKMSSSLSLCLCVLLATYFPFSSHQSVYYSLKCLILISSSTKQPARICYAVVWI